MNYLSWNTALWAAGIALVGMPYLLWFYYLALANLDRARAAGTLTKAAYVFMLPILVPGVVLDVLTNLISMSIITGQRPREWTVTQRLKKLKHDDSYRGDFARWLGQNALNPFDKSGDHLG